MNRSNNNELSGVRLVSLINTQSIDIANLETKNTDKMCLYGTGGYWTCFEHSAYFLSKLFPTLETFVINHPNYPFSIVGVSVSDRELNRYINNSRVIRKAADYLELSARDFDLTTFAKWHAGKVKGFREILS